MKKLIFLNLVMCLVFCMACKPESLEANSEVKEKMSHKEQGQTQKLIDRTAEVRVQVPDSNWKLEINTVRQTSDEIIVIAQLIKLNGMGMMVISDVVDTVAFKSKDLPIKYYIKGKSWDWDNPENYTFIENESQMTLSGEEISFEKVFPKRRGGPVTSPPVEIQ